MYIYIYFHTFKRKEKWRSSFKKKRLFLEHASTIYFFFSTYPEKSVPRLWICEDEQEGWLQTGGSLLNWRTVHASGRRSLASSQRIFRPLLKLEIHSFCVQTPYQEHAASLSSATIVVVVVSSEIMCLRKFRYLNFPIEISPSRWTRVSLGKL